MGNVMQVVIGLVAMGLLVAAGWFWLRDDIDRAQKSLLAFCVAGACATPYPALEGFLAAAAIGVAIWINAT